MSHIVDAGVVIQDLDALATACQEVGLELVRGQTHYKWYGRFVGDAPLPPGYKVEELGKCLHAIRVRGADSRTYEIGVVQRRDEHGRPLPGYTLLWDYWQGGHGLEKVAGKNLANLRQAYTLAGVKKTLGPRYSQIQTTRLPNGNLKVVLS